MRFGFSYGAGPPKEYRTLAEAEAAAQKLSQEYQTTIYVMGLCSEINAVSWTAQDRGTIAGGSGGGGGYTGQPADPVRRP